MEYTSMHVSVLSCPKICRNMHAHMDVEHTHTHTRACVHMYSTHFPTHVRLWQCCQLTCGQSLQGAGVLISSVDQHVTAASVNWKKSG